MTEINKVIRIFQPVVKDNIDDENASVFIDYQQNVAYGGHRRTWGVGDLLVRYKGDIPTKDIEPFPGVYHYSTNTFTRCDGLPAKALPQGGREILTGETCDSVFAHAFNTVNGYHQIVLNPREILDFVESQTMTSGVGERVLNIEPFEVANERGHFVAKVDEFEGQLVVGFKSPQGYIPLFLDERASLISTERLRLDEWVVVAPVGVVEGRRIAKVISKYEPGVRVAIQHFKSGLLMPGSPRYSVLPGEDGNDIRAAETKVLPFIEGQDKMNLRTAPMLSVQLDTLVRALEPLSEYKRVELLYKNSHTNAVLIPVPEGKDYIIDVVFSPLSVYMSGKVLTT